MVSLKTGKATRKCDAQVAEQGEAQDGLADRDRGTKEAEVARQDPTVTHMLERLSQLETRVGTQLNHLVELQQQQVVCCPSVCLSVCLCQWCLSICICLLSIFLSMACVSLSVPIVNSNLLAVTGTRR